MWQPTGDCLSEAVCSPQGGVFLPFLVKAAGVASGFR